MSLLCHAMPFDSPFSLPSEYFALTRSEVFSLILSSRLSALTCQCHQFGSNRRLRQGFRSLHNERPFGTDKAVVLAANSGPTRLMSRYPAIRIDRRHPRVTARPFHALFDFVSGSVSVLRFEGKV